MRMIFSCFHGISCILICTHYLSEQRLMCVFTILPIYSTKISPSLLLFRLNSPKASQPLLTRCCNHLIIFVLATPPTFVSHANLLWVQAAPPPMLFPLAPSSWHRPPPFKHQFNLIEMLYQMPDECILVRCRKANQNENLRFTSSLFKSIHLTARACHKHQDANDVL